MSLGAKKFSFKMKEESVEESTKDSVSPSVLKFHHLPNEKIQPEEEKSYKKKSILALKENDSSKEIKRKKYNSDNYFGVKNHIDLFEIGKHFSYLYQNGIKSLAFYGSTLTPSVQHSILGISSFFNYHKNIKATVFIDKFEGSELSKFLKPTHIEVESAVTGNDEDVYEVYACDGIEIIELSKLKHIAYKMGPTSFSDFLTALIKRSDIVLWDLPPVSTIDKEREIYLPIVNVIDSLSLVVDTGITKRNEIDEMNDFAGKYQIQVEGVLLYKRK